MPHFADLPADSEEREIAAFLGDRATYNAVSQRWMSSRRTSPACFWRETRSTRSRSASGCRLSTFRRWRTAAAPSAREVEVNRPHAPGIYLGAVPIVRRDRGRLGLGGEGRIIDWAVHMRRFPEAAVLVNRTLQGPLPDGLAKELARMVASYHRQSAVAEIRDGSAGIRARCPPVDGGLQKRQAESAATRLGLRAPPGPGLHPRGPPARCAGTGRLHSTLPW